MKRMIKKQLKFGPSIDGTTLETEVNFRSVVEELHIKEPKKLSYDFSAAVAGVLDLPEKSWKVRGLGVSKFVPSRILHEFYDGVLLYSAMQAHRLHHAFGGLVDHRILLKCVSCLPEIMVKYRFYLGVANDDGEYRIETGEGDDLQLIGIQDPYDRLFWLDTPSTRKMISGKYGKTSIFVKGKREIEVVNENGVSRRQLGFRKCMSSLFKKESDPVRAFLDSLYTNVRIPEFHGCRIGDNALFQLDEIMANLVKAMNYLYTKNLNMPYKRWERGPFSLKLYRMAGSPPLPKGRMLVHYSDVLMELAKTREFY